VYAEPGKKTVSCTNPGFTSDLELFFGACADIRGPRLGRRAHGEGSDRLSQDVTTLSQDESRLAGKGDGTLKNKVHLLFKGLVLVVRRTTKGRVSAEPGKKPTPCANPKSQVKMEGNRLNCGAGAAPRGPRLGRRSGKAAADGSADAGWIAGFGAIEQATWGREQVTWG
jgi:hypothetical protein